MNKILITFMLLIPLVMHSMIAKEQRQSTAQPAAPPPNFENKMAKVNGISIHYVIGGQGEPLILIHGFGENWFTWNRILPELSKHFTVIAPDLRGFGESDKPTGGYDKKNMAVDMHELTKSLGYNKVSVVGHDIGLMVAYAYAAQFPDGVKKLVLMDAILPGIEPEWTRIRAQAWWWGFFGWPASGEIIEGKQKEFLTSFWPTVSHSQDPFTEEEKDEFIRSFEVPGATNGAFHWFAAFPQDAKDDQEWQKHKLQMPVLSIYGEYGATYLTEHIRLVADHVKGIAINNAGHWLVQENTSQVQSELLTFLADNEQ